MKNNNDIKPKKSNPILTKSYSFSVEVILICRSLKDIKEFEIASQFLRSGTSVGANVEEAQGAQSRKDFIHKMSIAYKEIRESIYWIRLLIDTSIGDTKKLTSLKSDAIEISKIISSIIITSKNS